MMALVGIAGILLASFIAALGGLYLKKGSARFSLNPKEIVRNKELLLGVFLYGLSTALFVPSLRSGPLSLLYPFVSTTYIWIALLSREILKERITRLQWIGIIVTLLGVALIGVS